MSADGDFDTALLADFNSVAQTAAFMGIPERTLYDLIRAGKIGHIRLSERVIRIQRDQVLAFLEANTHQPEQPRARRLA